MPCYNSEKYISEAIESVLDQTFEDFELLIFEDGSTDNSLTILKSFEEVDDRIRIFYDGENKGYLERLNYGLSVAKGKYIARMDSDDICHPQRFELQYQYLESNPEVGVLATDIECIDEYGFDQKNWIVSLPKQFYTMALLFKNNICHPSVMLRKSELERSSFEYNKDYDTAEDYKAWVDFSKHTQIECLDKVLLKYRVHSKSVSREKRKIQENVSRGVINEQLAELGISLVDYEFALHKRILRPGKRSFHEYKESLKWLIRLYQANKVKKVWDTSNLRSFFLYLGQSYLKNSSFGILDTVKRRLAFYFFKRSLAK